MNTTPYRKPNHTTSYPRKFDQLLREKSENICDRVFVFAAINEFLHKCDRLEECTQ